jgi:DNA-binding LytR/AlgR family response regulator
LSRRIIEEYIRKTETLQLSGSFSNALDAINFLKTKESVDLVFLDIEMPEMTGIDFLDSLKILPQIIIISSKSNYAVNAFDYDVTDYLLKPVTYARFFKSIDKAINRYNKTSYENSIQDAIFIKKNLSLIKLRFDDILWVEALENYVTFYTYNEKYTIHFTMKALEAKLPSFKFFRVHRSYIVNHAAIDVIEDNTILIKVAEGIRYIPIGKSYRDKLMNDINFIR